MAASPAPSNFIPIEEYLRTDYRPDVEYIDGELRPKDGWNTEELTAQWVHAQLQMFIRAWFIQHMREWGIRTGAEARTRVSQGRVRLPGVVVVYDRPQTATLTEPPLIAIEIVSPSDAYHHLFVRMRDLAAMGVENLWIIDPQARSAQQYRDGAWIDTTRLSVSNSPIYLDVNDLFAQLDA